MKQSDKLLDRVRDVYRIVRSLDKICGYATVVKPRFYLLIAYLNVIQGRKSEERLYLRKAQKLASVQGNKLIEAWSMQCKRVTSITHVANERVNLFEMDEQIASIAVMKSNESAA